MSTYLDRKGKGLCVSCGTEYSNNGMLFCDKCREFRKELTKTNKDKLRKAGLCLDCRQPLDIKDKLRCPDCLAKGVVSTLKRQHEHQLNHLCVKCGEPATVRDKQCCCAICWFKDIAKSRTGSTKNWLFIKQLLGKQDYRCIYTGKELRIGENASLDHIVPKSKGGDNSILNLQWVDLQINVMKNNMSHQEFISTIQLILSRQTLQEQTYAVTQSVS